MVNHIAMYKRKGKVQLTPKNHGLEIASFESKYTILGKSLRIVNQKSNQTYSVNQIILMAREAGRIQSIKQNTITEHYNCG
jgi:hypothetical protein